jgi:hypothetical protein
MTTIKTVVLSCLVSILTVVALDRIGFFHNTVYDCDSTYFKDFPRDVQEECVHILENELKDLMKRKMEEDAKKGITQI